MAFQIKLVNPPTEFQLGRKPVYWQALFGALFVSDTLRLDQVWDMQTTIGRVTDSLRITLIDINYYPLISNGLELTIQDGLMYEFDWGRGILYSVGTLPTPTLTLYTLTVKAGLGGAASKSPSKTGYTYGELVTLTAQPASGYQFDYWDVDGEWLTISPSINYMVTKNATITAHFLATSAPTPTPIPAPTEPKFRNLKLTYRGIT